MQSPTVYPTCKTYERSDHAQRALKKPDKPDSWVARRSREPEEGSGKRPRYATAHTCALYPQSGTLNVLQTAPKTLTQQVDTVIFGLGV